MSGRVRVIAGVDDIAVVGRKGGLSAHQMQWQALCDSRDGWRLTNAEVYYLVWVELIAVNVAKVDVSGESYAVAGRQKLVCQLGCSVRQPIVADSLHEVTWAKAEAEGRDGGWPAVGHGIQRELDFGRVMRVGAEQRYRVLRRHPVQPPTRRKFQGGYSKPTLAAPPARLSEFLSAMWRHDVVSCVAAIIQTHTCRAERTRPRRPPRVPSRKQLSHQNPLRRGDAVGRTVYCARTVHRQR